MREYCWQQSDFHKVISSCHQQETATIDVNKKMSELKTVLSDVNKQLDQVGGITVGPKNNKATTNRKFLRKQQSATLPRSVDKAEQSGPRTYKTRGLPGFH